MAREPSECLRVALILGGLGHGGAEKQAVYMADALRRDGVDARIFSPEGPGAFAAELLARGVLHRQIRGAAHPATRLVAMLAEMRRFRPHVIQSALFYWNLHATLLGKLCGALAIGAVRSDGARDVALYGRRGRWLAVLPPQLIANSHAARRNLESLGVAPRKIAVLPNAIDLDDFDRKAGERDEPPTPVAIAVGRLLAVKRYDVFLEALAIARREVPALLGKIVGDGPERSGLERRADLLGLRPDGVAFLGARDDVPALLAGSSFLASTSDVEGFPNVLLEAMAARLPVVTTPAGDAGRVAEDGVTGWVVPRGDAQATAQAMIRLAGSPALRNRMGEAGRDRVEMSYGFGGLADRLRSIYSDQARRQGHDGVARLLSRPLPAAPSGVER